jgi:hypothetical protein
VGSSFGLPGVVVVALGDAVAVVVLVAAVVVLVAAAGVVLRATVPLLPAAPTNPPSSPETAIPTAIAACFVRFMWVTSKGFRSRRELVFPCSRRPLRAIWEKDRTSPRIEEWRCGRDRSLVSVRPA